MHRKENNYDKRNQNGRQQIHDDVSHKLKTNAMNDLVFHLTENIEKGVALEGITVIKK